MTVQIFGTKKCRTTQKALRFFKERGMDIALRDIGIKPPSPGELDKMMRQAGGSLIDPLSPAYEKGGYKHRDFDEREELLQHPEMMLTPLVRHGDLCVAGDKPVGWNKILHQAKS